MPWGYIAAGVGVLVVFPGLLKRLGATLGQLLGKGAAGAVGAVGELAGEAADALADSNVGKPGAAVGDWLYEAVNTGSGAEAGADSAEDQVWTPTTGPGPGDWYEITEG